MTTKSTLLITAIVLITSLCIAYILNLNLRKTAQSGNNAPAISKVAARTIIVEGKPFQYTPNTITVKQGDTVTIVFNNLKGTHDLRIDELNVATKIIAEGETDTVQFVANKKGSFEYYCSLDNHKEMGMKGILIVE